MSFFILNICNAATFKITGTPNKVDPILSSTAGDVNIIYNLCVYTSSGDGHYKATISDDNPNNGRFSSIDEFDNELRYHIYWRDDVSSSVWTELQDNTASNQFSNANTLDENCATGESTTASIKIEFRESQYSMAAAAEYIDNLQILISQ